MSEVLPNVGCVAINGRAVLIRGAPGSGKSALALALIDRGATLIGDDGVTLELRGVQLWAAPPPNIGGKLEIRGVGLVDVPTCTAPVALVIRIDRDAPRFVDQPSTANLCGASIPELALFADSATLPLRTEWALRRHGLA